MKEIIKEYTDHERSLRNTQIMKEIIKENTDNDRY